VRSHVATPETEQTAGVAEVTSSKCPRESNPEFLPFANNVDATNRYDCLLANLSPTEVPKRDERESALEKYGVTTIAASPAAGAGSGAGVATGTGLISIVPKTFMLFFCHSSMASTYIV
jgi:hypothetical protein